MEMIRGHRQEYKAVPHPANRFLIVDLILELFIHEVWKETSRSGMIWTGRS